MATLPIPEELTPDPGLEQLSDLEIIEQEESAKKDQERAEEELQNILTSTLQSIENQERSSREPLIRLWKYLDLLWTGIGNFYWNESTSRYNAITYDDLRHLSESADIDPSLLNKTLNLIRPYGESLAGVLTPGTPNIIFFPANADKIEDIRTAKVSKIIEKKISSDNNIKTILIQIIMQLWNGGFAAVHNYCHKSSDYGTIEKLIIEDEDYLNISSLCPNCGGILESIEQEYKIPDPSQGVEVGPNEVGEEGEIPESNKICPNCGPIEPIVESEKVTKQVNKGTEKINKSRILLKVYGPMEVKIPTKASSKEQVIWLLFEEELHESLAKSLYPEYWDKIKGGEVSGELAYDRWARSQYENMGELNNYYVTIRQLYLRPSAYNILGDKEKSESLHSQFPDGCVAIFSGDTFLFAEEAKLDEEWSLSFNPLYKRIYADPLGKALIPLQESANDLFQLELETVKYSIPQTFADPNTFDFQAYSQSKNQPGLIYPMKASPLGGKIADSFYETRTATLPKEVSELNAKIETLLQFISGVLPPVFGGSQNTGSKTLGEVEQNRNQALQRLSLVWSVVTNLYTEFMSKSVKQYREELKKLDQDEAVVEMKSDSFINTWIKISELSGEVGRVTPEFTEQFPTTWSQRKATLMELIGLNNEMIGSIFLHPENIQKIAIVLGLDDLYIPGEDQRNKQITEIIQLISIPNEPMIDPVSGMPLPIQPIIIPPEPVDNDEIHIAVLSAYISSDKGQILKDINPIAYQSLMMHLMAHQEKLAAIMVQVQEQENQNEEGKQDKSFPVKGEN